MNQSYIVPVNDESAQAWAKAALIDSLKNEEAVIVRVSSVVDVQDAPQGQVAGLTSLTIDLGSRRSMAC